MSDKKEEQSKPQQAKETVKKLITRLNNSDTQTKQNHSNETCKGSIKGLYDKQEIKGRVSAGDDD